MGSLLGIQNMARLYNTSALLASSALANLSRTSSVSGFDVIKPTQSIAATGQISALAPISPAPDVTQPIPSYQLSLSSMGLFKARMEQFADNMDKLKSASDIGGFQVTSKDDSIVAVTLGQQKSPLVAPMQLDINVSQVAQAQILVSNILNAASSGQKITDPDNEQLGTGTITVEFGRYDSENNTFQNMGGKRRSVQFAVTHSNNTLNGIKRTINQSDTGILAEVSGNATDGYKIHFKSHQTGTNGALRVIVVDDDDPSNYHDDKGISQLAYDPTGEALSGQTMTQEQVAQNAVISINGATLTSQSNQVSTPLDGVSITAKKAGKTVVAVERDTSVLKRAATDLVDAYNKIQTGVGSAGINQKLLEEYRAIMTASGAKSPNRLEMPTGNTQKVDLTTPVPVLSQVQLEDAGIVLDTNKRLKLEAEKFSSVAKDQPEGVASLLASTASKLLTKTKEAIVNGSALEGLSSSFQKILQSTILASNPYLAGQYNSQAAKNVQQYQSSLFDYTPTSRSLFGIAQYLSVAGL